MTIFRKLNRFVESVDEKEYERDMRDALRSGQQKTPDNQAPDYSHVEELSAWSGFDTNKAILSYLEDYPDRCWKYLNQTDEFNDGLNCGPWCIERLAETDVGFEGPRAGLTHSVFYNQAEVGKVTLKPTGTLPVSIEDADGDYQGVFVEVEIDNVLLIKADHVAALISVAIIPIDDFEPRLFTDDWRFTYQRSIQTAIHNSIANQSPTEPLDFVFLGAVQKARLDIQNQ